jgi:dTDP-glucose 4,6-dehydratase/UDP-glucuronate decarboxylase
MSDFIRSGLLYGFIKPRGGLSNERIYCYVSDMVTMILNVVLNGTKRVYNLSGSGLTSIGGLAKLISEIIGAKLELVDSEGDKSAPECVIINNERYLKEFGHPNFVPLKAGLAKTIEWFKYIYDEGK